MRPEGSRAGGDERRQRRLRRGAARCPGAAASRDPLRPGEAYVTRFSGTTTVAGRDGRAAAAINVDGTVGSIIDVRAPRKPPRGEHWYDEPQRNPVTAGQVGQVFGVVLDDAT